MTSHSKEIESDYPIAINPKMGLEVYDEDKAFNVFISGSIDPILTQIESYGLNLVADATTEEGRKQIEAVSKTVSRLSKKLDDFGKVVKDAYIHIPKKVDETRRLIRSRLEEVNKKVNQELDKVKACESLIDMIEAYPISHRVDSIEDLKHGLAFLESNRSKFLEHLAERGNDAVDKSILAVSDLIKIKQKELDDKLELERLRAKEAEEKRKQEIESARKEGEQIAIERHRELQCGTIWNNTNDNEKAQEFIESANSPLKNDAEILSSIFGLDTSLSNRIIDFIKMKGLPNVRFIDNQ